MVLVDGQPLDQPWLSASARAATGTFGRVTVPKGDVFILGDNRARPATAVRWPFPAAQVAGPILRTVPGPSRRPATPTPSPTSTTPAFTT